MNEKRKKIVSGFLEMVGYGFAIGYVSILTFFCYNVFKYGGIIIGEPNKIMLLSEIVIGGSIILFLLDRFYKSLKKRGKELIDEACHRFT